MMERSAFLRNLGSFIVKTDQSLKAIAEKLGWNAKKLADVGFDKLSFQLCVRVLMLFW